MQDQPAASIVQCCCLYSPSFWGRGNGLTRALHPPLHHPYPSNITHKKRCKEVSCQLRGWPTRFCYFFLVALSHQLEVLAWWEIASKTFCENHFQSVQCSLSGSQVKGLCMYSIRPVICYRIQHF